MTGPSLQELLPWRPPFVMVDRMIECVPHERIATEKKIGGDDLLGRSHARRRHGFAGAMVLEGMNQSAALLYQLTYGKFEPSRVPLLGYLKAELGSCAAPGDSIRFSVTAVKMTPTHGLFEAEARAGERTLARSELAFAVASSQEAIS
jgi:3-hydroxyacyl-[acyl-carrier-protein] dehydratase